MESQSQQQQDEFSQSPSMFHSQSYLNMYNTPPHVPMPFSMPPHGFSAMLTSASPGSPMVLCAPTMHGRPPQSPNVGDNTFHSETMHQVKKGRKSSRRSEVGTKKAKTTKTKGMKHDADDDAAEKDGLGLWKDYWVEHLMHIRGGMHDEFNKLPKQGVDLWGKVSTKLAGMFSDYNKDSEACRKKWVRVNKLYREDKAHNAISGNDRKRSCKWYDIVDEYMHDRANVQCKSHASAAAEVSLVDGVDLSEAHGTTSALGGSASHGGGSTSTGKGARINRTLDDSFVRIADSGRELVDHLKEATTRRELQQDKALSIFEALQASMAAFLEHAKK